MSSTYEKRRTRVSRGGRGGRWGRCPRGPMRGRVDILLSALLRGVASDMHQRTGEKGEPCSVPLFIRAMPRDSLSHQISKARSSKKRWIYSLRCRVYFPIIFRISILFALLKALITSFPSDVVWFRRNVDCLYCVIYTIGLRVTFYRDVNTSQ